MCALRGNGNKQKKKLRLPGNNDSFQPLHLMRAPAARQNTPAAACYLTKKNPPSFSTAVIIVRKKAGWGII